MNEHTRTMLSKLAVELEDILEDVHVEPVEVLKNNVKLDGLSFRKQGENSGPNIYPTVEDMEALETDLRGVAEKLAEKYRGHEHLGSECMELIEDFEKAKDHLRLFLLGKKNNAEYLKGKPYRTFLEDMAVTVYIELGIVNGTGASAVLTESLLESWGVSFEEVYQIASANTLAHAKVQTIIDIFAERTGMDVEDAREILGDAAPDMYVYTTDYTNRGAGVLPCLLDSIKERFEKFVILPSSIHEVIVIPFELMEEKDQGTLNDMVTAVNRDELEVEDVLSDHAYFWNGEAFEV